MSAGHPLDDQDRLPWLALIRSTAERVCREEWVLAGKKERGGKGPRHVHGPDENSEDHSNIHAPVPASTSSNGDSDSKPLETPDEIAQMAEWEFGEGWRWKNNRASSQLPRDQNIPGLGRPAVIIACSALKRWYRDILRGEVRVGLPDCEDDEESGEGGKVSLT